MSGIVSDKSSEYFINELTRRNWKSSKIIGYEFEIGHWAVLRLTRHDIQETVRTETLLGRIKTFAQLPLKRLLILEGNVSDILQRRSKRTFHMEFSINKYLNYSKLLREVVVKQGICVVQTFDKTMTLELLLDLTDKADPLLPDFRQFDDRRFGLSRNRFFNIVSYLSAYFGIPFDHLSNEQIIEGLRKVKIPGVGNATISDLTDRLLALTPSTP